MRRTCTSFGRVPFAPPRTVAPQDWRQRYFYPDMVKHMASDPGPARLLHPLDFHSVFSSDAADAANFASHAEGPDVIVLHSCAWELPLINRSRLHWPFMKPHRMCSDTPKAFPVRLQHKRGAGSGGASSSIAGSGDTRLARIAAAPCLFRGDELSDDTIFESFAERLRAAIAALRSRFTGRLLLRNCHAGTE